MKAPFPFAGGKARAASLIWKAFGDVPVYVEPFFGSGAVLFGRPHVDKQQIEIINDKNAFITNVWRAIQRDPEGVARFCSGPLHEVDVHARHRWLIGQKTLVEKLIDDP